MNTRRVIPGPARGPVALPNFKAVAAESWDPQVWEDHGVRLLIEHFGVDCVVRVPDDAGGDGGLDAYVTQGMGYQCYAPEDEPLTNGKRATLQKSKIGKDLAKLKANVNLLTELLGDVKLHAWVLLTPIHRSADVIVYCNTKAVEVQSWGLPFLDEGFRVLVHDLQTFSAEHALLTHQMIFPDVLTAPPAPPNPGIDFGNAAGEHITLMDEKLAAIPGLVNATERTAHRAALLEGQFLGDSLLDRFQTRQPDLATLFRTKFDDARREMLLSSATSPGAARFYLDLKKDLISRFSVYTMSQENAEHLANKCIADWLQQCPLKFVAAT
jgi:hypothetical protein